MRKYKECPAIVRYLLNSCMVTVLDVIIVWIGYKGLGIDIVTANTIGVVAGFLIDYWLSVKFVFRKADGTVGFLIYLGTFLVGLVLADWLIYEGETALFLMIPEQIRFLFSKGLSIALPFFVMYFVRKLLYHIWEQYRTQGEKKNEV